jgi:hypothetical protein
MVGEGHCAAHRVPLQRAAGVVDRAGSGAGRDVVKHDGRPAARRPDPPEQVWQAYRYRTARPLQGRVLDDEPGAAVCTRKRAQVRVSGGVEARQALDDKRPAARFDGPAEQLDEVTHAVGRLIRVAEQGNDR